MTELPMVDVLKLKPLPGNRLWLRFTGGREGIRDITDLLSGQEPMLRPLKQPEFFSRVFIEMGAPTWPNGFDLDPIHLYMRMRDGGLLARNEAA